jgi:RNA polymerase sigma factor (sigma-70 family)
MGWPVTVQRLADMKGMAPNDCASDAALLLASRIDPAAFAEFYERYEQPLLAYFGSRTRDPELTADLTAEVFASALEHADRFDDRRLAGANAAPWLFAIAHTTLLKSFRRGRVAADARRRIGMEPFALEDDAYARVEAIASIELDLDQLLAALPEEQRVALLARIVEEREYGEIAAQLRCSELVIRKRVSRALTTLRSSITSRPKETTT